MSGRSLILAVKIIGDASDAIKAMDQAGGKTKGFGDNLRTAANWGVGALAGITAAAKECGEAASELQQSTGAVESVFGGYADKMLEHGKKAADAVGLSQSQYGNMASILGAQLKNMGLEIDAVAGQSNDLIGLGADLAATYGGTTADAVGALSSLLRGERDPIERYGVSIKQADIDAQKAAMGLDKLTGEAAKNADLQATLALLTKQTADAQGQFSREAGSAAGSAQIASAQFENAKAALGEQLLPIMAEGARKLSELAGWFQENAAWVTPLVGVLAGLAAAVVVINAAYTAFTAVQAMQTAAQWASNAAWLASPITWIILAIIAAIAILIAIVVLVVQNWDAIKAAGVAAWEAIVGWVKQAIDWIGNKIAAVINGAKAIWTGLKLAASAVWQSIIEWVQKAILWLGDKLLAPIRAAKKWFEDLKAGVAIVFQGIIDWVKDAIKWIADLASNAIPGWAKDLLGMSNKSLTVTPQMAGFVPPQYATTLMVDPMLTGDMPTLYTATAPSALAIRAGAGSAGGTTVVDSRTYNITFPNFLGDRRDLEQALREILRRTTITNDRLVTP